jgi:hypothetical protein
VLALSAIQDGVQLIPTDPKAISEQKTAISIGGQTLLVTVRKHDDGRLEQLDGFHCTTALRELGRSDVSAVVFSGLTDWEAEFRRLVGYLGPHIKALDKAILLARLLELRAQKASRDETPSGGHQPSEKYLRKLAKELQVSKDQLFRSQKIARIVPSVRQKIRELKLDNNQAALLKIAEAGDTADLQIATATELPGQKKKGVASPKNLPKPVGDESEAGQKAALDGSGPGSSDTSLRRDRPEIAYDQLKGEWSRVEKLFLAADVPVREQFIAECLKPMLSQVVSCEVTG